MIRFENITTEYFSSLSFEIKEGSVCKIIPASDEKKKNLLNIITGIKEPISGKVFLFGEDIYSMFEKKYIKLFHRIGLVLENGGIISNLKVWENITLPVWYHKGKKPEDMEGRIIGIFEELGRSRSYLGELMGKLPGPLPIHEKRIIGLIRTILLEPELMIYESLFEGLSPEIAQRLMTLTEKFHLEKAGRSSVYITTNELPLKDLKADVVLRL